MKTSFKIQHTFVKEELTSDSLLKAFSLWLYMKSKYKKAIFYNYAPLKTGTQINVSAYNLKKYVPIMIKKGWAEIRNGHLHLIAFNKMMEKSKNYIEIKTQSLKQIIDDLRFSYIQKDYSQQKFMSDISFSRLKANDYSYKAQLKLYKKYGKSGMNIDRTITSYRRIAKQLNLSLSRTHTLVSNWCFSGRMRITPIIEVVQENFKGAFYPKMTDSGLLLSKEGRLILIKGSEFCVAEV